MLSRGIRPLRRALTTASRARPAFAFDIDGVLKQGQRVLPEAKEALNLLISLKIPFILLTNGGGVTEEARSIKLSGELGIPISPASLVQSHTIFRSLLESFADKPILVLGGVHDGCRNVAEHYGFQQAYCPSDLLAYAPASWPFTRLTERELRYVKTDVDFSKIQFAAILAFHDSRDWGRDVQLSIDLLRSKNGVFGTLNPDPSSPQLPVYFSNPDLLFGNDFPLPRFGAGAFQEAMAAVYLSTTGRTLERTVGGKPTKPTYDYANLLLQARAKKYGVGIGKVYMVGDNPASDIAGANAYGWDSILVRTGVFQGPDNCSPPATVVKDHVLDAVMWALKDSGERA